jgi:DHA1 family bicyclomycin/chloramphenicol resistance-like MFS transporter
MRTMGKLMVDRDFMAFALPTGLAGAGLFAYIAGSSFVYQGVYGLSPQGFALVFGLNGVVVGISSQTNRLLVGSLSSFRLFRISLGAQTFFAAAVVAVVLVGGLGLVGILIPLLLAIATNGFTQPNGTALAMSGHPEAAGAGAALTGTIRFAAGSLAAPLVGVAGPRTALPMALTMLAIGALAGILHLALRWPRRGVAVGLVES